MQEVEVSFRSLDEWQKWRGENTWATDGAVIDAIVDGARRWGIVSPHLGPVPPSEIEVGNRNYRESFRARGLNARARAVLDHFACTPYAKRRFSARIYAPEAVTPFAMELRGRYPRFWGSEYLPSPALRERFFPIPHENLMSLSFADSCFDVVFSNDIFEHVSDLPKAVDEIGRVLKPGGLLLGTFPFAYNSAVTLQRAYLRRGVLHIVGPPEYHSDPVEPLLGTLVYQIPAWDVIDLFSEVGFASAELLFVSSRLRGICAAELAGVFMLRAVR